ncbi:uncharacterized protein CLUP02_07413 [Colletotrichum lupini]|uniref:Uncharacterized protein n=1 Tax=Colletotrichum lupini TaxID=145971 RepID=A0A9Q8SQY8_9PEZI|nr:uncharacterized protein CLUP02_07413 [Colletotrichum lupini]UQC81927.1 hypothetical protein CLUP02_07413 [Colletotrichum lupini]
MQVNIFSIFAVMSALVASSLGFLRAIADNDGLDPSWPTNYLYNRRLYCWKQ